MAINSLNDIPGLLVWKDAKDASTFPSTGGVVTSAVDKSGEGVDLTYLVGSPSAGTFNGHNVIDFDGSSAIATYGALEDGQPGCITVYFVPTSGSLAGNQMVASSARRQDLAVGLVNGEAGVFVAGAFYSLGVSAVVGEMMVITFNVNSSSSAFYVNGVLSPVTLNAFSDRWREGVIGGLSNATANPAVGEEYKVVEMFTGSYQGHAVHDNPITATQAVDVYDYLTDYWGAGNSTIAAPVVLTPTPTPTPTPTTPTPTDDTVTPTPTTSAPGGVKTTLTSPLDLPGLVAFKLAKDSADITLDPTGKIISVTDKNGGVDFTHSVGNPTYARTHNGHNVINFDGSSALAAYGPAEDGQPGYAWCSFIPDSTTGTSIFYGSARAGDLGIGISDGQAALFIGGSILKLGVAATVRERITIDVELDSDVSTAYVNGALVEGIVFPRFSDRWREGLIGGVSTTTAPPADGVEYGVTNFARGALLATVQCSDPIPANLRTQLHHWIDNVYEEGAITPEPAIGLEALGDVRSGEVVIAKLARDYTAIDSVRYNDRNVAFTPLTSREVSIEVPTGGQSLGSAHELVISADGQTHKASAVFLPPAGFRFVTLDKPYSAFNSNSIFFGQPHYSPLAQGWQVAIPEDVNGNLTLIDGSAVVQIEGISDGTIFDLDFYIYDPTDSYSRGTKGTVTFTQDPTPVPDFVPDPFSVGNDVIDAEPGDITVRSFTISGLNSGELLTANALGLGEVSLDQTSWGESVEVQLGTTVFLRLAASLIRKEVVSGGVEVAGISATFSITTFEGNLPIINQASEIVQVGGLGTLTLANPFEGTLIVRLDGEALTVNIISTTSVEFALPAVTLANRLVTLNVTDNVGTSNSMEVFVSAPASKQAVLVQLTDSVLFGSQVAIGDQLVIDTLDSFGNRLYLNQDLTVTLSPATPSGSYLFTVQILEGATNYTTIRSTSITVQHTQFSSGGNPVIPGAFNQLLEGITATDERPSDYLIEMNTRLRVVQTGSDWPY